MSKDSQNRGLIMCFCSVFIGYYGEGMTAIILFSSCYLPENTIENYEYVMDNLFK